MLQSYSDANLHKLFHPVFHTFLVSQGVYCFARTLIAKLLEHLPNSALCHLGLEALNVRVLSRCEVLASCHPSADAGILYPHASY